MHCPNEKLVIDAIENELLFGNYDSNLSGMMLQETLANKNVIPCVVRMAATCGGGEGVVGSHTALQNARRRAN